MHSIKELSPIKSLEAVKALLKRKTHLDKKQFKPGHLIFTHYDAQDKTNTYDMTPLVLVLKTNNTHTLGLNFHWIPYSMRIYLVMHIMQMNKMRIKHRKPLNFSYLDLKPMLKSLGYAPCIRVYINKRFAKEGVILSSSYLLEAARLKAETFTRGKYTASQLYAMARAKGKSKNVK